MASPQVPSGSLGGDDAPIYRALNPTTEQATASRAPVLYTNTMDETIPSEQETTPSPRPSPPPRTLSLFQEYWTAESQGPSPGHEVLSTAAAQDESTTDTLTGHQPAKDRTALSVPPAPNEPTGQSGAPKSLYDLAVGSVQPPGETPIIVDQVKVMIQDSIRTLGKYENNHYMYELFISDI